MKYCCKEFEKLDHHWLEENYLGKYVIEHYDSEEFFCCHVILSYCPFCGKKL